MFFNPTIAAITLRGLLGRRRSLLIALPPLILLALTIGLRVGDPNDHAWPGAVIGNIGLVVVVPLTSMIIGTSVLGTEVDDSSIMHLLATPVSRTTVVLTKWIVASAATLVFAVVPLAVAAFIATGGTVDNPGPLNFDVNAVGPHGTTKMAVGVILAAVVGAIAYSAFFLFLSAVTKRSVAVSLIYILVWENLLTAQVSGLRLLSVGQYELGIAGNYGHMPNIGQHLTLSTSLVMAVILSALTLFYGSYRLRSFRLTGDAA